MAILIPESRALEGLVMTPFPSGPWDAGATGPVMMGRRSSHFQKSGFLGEWGGGWWEELRPLLACVSVVMVNRVARRPSEVPGECMGIQASLWNRPWTAECCQNVREFQKLKTMALCKCGEG